MMTNTTAALATAADITTRDEYIAFYTAPRNISAFAQAVIPARLLAEAQGDDYVGRSVLADSVKQVMRLEAMTDAALQAEYASNEAAHLDNLDWDEYDLNDREDHYHLQGLIRSLLAFRQEAREAAAAEQRYTGLAPLTHRPFAALAV